MLETNSSIARFLLTIEQFGLGTDYDLRLPDLLGSVTLGQAATPLAACCRLSAQLFRWPAPIGAVRLEKGTGIVSLLKRGRGRFPWTISRP